MMTTFLVDQINKIYDYGASFYRQSVSKKKAFQKNGFAFIILFPN